MTAAAEDPASGRPEFERLRQDEDWSGLCSSNRSPAWYDAIKCMPISADHPASLSVGGELRERYEYARNPLWGEDPQDEHGVFLQRYVLHGDLRVMPGLRLFGQLYSALEDGRAGPVSPVDENRIDLQQAFLEVQLPSNIALRFGRQELRYGSARLVDVREGPNVRRKFDGVRARLDFRDWRVDALAVRPVLADPGAFDDGSDQDQALWGVYGTGNSSWLPFGTSVDLYYLGYENEAGSYDQGTGHETRHTIGARVWGERAGWDWNQELIYQFGAFGDGEIRAWSAASDTGFTWRDVPWSPRLGVSANLASGDDDLTDDELGTFNPLFPRGNYFSELALLGPRNFVNLHPSLAVSPTDELSLGIGIDWFWRLERADGIYSPGGGLLRSGAGSDERFVATNVSFSAAWQIDSSVSVTGIYAHSFPGGFVRETGPSQDIDFVEITLKAQF